MAAILIPHHTIPQHKIPQHRVPVNTGALAPGNPSAAPTATTYLMRRLGAALVAVVLLAGLWTMVSIAVDSFTADAGAGLTPSAHAARTQTYVVQPGDTLWSIAATIDTDGDLRDTVDQLAATNGGSSFQAGDRISIPARAGTVNR